MPSSLYPEPLMRLATKPLLSVMLLPVQPHVFLHTAAQCTKSGKRPPPLPSAIMNCAANAANVTHHELIDKFFIRIAEYLFLSGALAYIAPITILKTAPDPRLLVDTGDLIMPQL